MLHKSHRYWQELYNQLRGPDWPECPLEVDFYQLPQWVQDELMQFGYQPPDSFPKRFITPGLSNINVFYLPEHNGGGTGHGQEYIKLIKQRYPGRVFDKCYEWCSGPGFIAYSILDHGLCNNICLTDICDSALMCAEETKNYPSNNCQDNVSIYLLKDLNLLPEKEMFDLVVSNPPHANCLENIKNHTANENRITSDLNWEAHQNFFKNIKKHLAPDGIILLQENHAGSDLSDFALFIEQAGLTVTDYFLSDDWYNASVDHTDPANWPVHKIYYIEIQHQRP